MRLKWNLENKIQFSRVRVQIVCQSQVTRTWITITTQSLVYGPRSQYLKFSRFDDLFYAQFHISCIRAHLRNNYKKFSNHWAWLYYDPFNIRRVPHTTSGDRVNGTNAGKKYDLLFQRNNRQISWWIIWLEDLKVVQGFGNLVKLKLLFFSDIAIVFWLSHSKLLRSCNNL